MEKLVAGIAIFSFSKLCGNKGIYVTEACSCFRKVLKVTILGDADLGEVRNYAHPQRQVLRKRIKNIAKEMKNLEKY